MTTASPFNFFAGIKTGGSVRSHSIPRLAPVPPTDTLKQATDKLVQEHDLAERKVRTYQTQLQESDTYIKHLETAYNDLSQKNGQLRALVDIDHKELHKLSSKLQDHQGFIDKLTDEATKLKAQIKKAEADRVMLLEQLEESEASHQECDSMLNMAMADIDRLNGELTQANDARTLLEASLQTTINELTSSLNTEKEGRAQDTTRLTTEVQEALDNHNAVIAQVQKLQEELTAAKEASERQLATAATDKSAAKDKIRELEGRLEDGRKVAEGMQALYDDVVTEKASLEELVASLKTGKEQLEQKLHGLQQEHESTQEDLEALIKQHEDFKNEAAAAAEAHSEELHKLQETLSATETEAQNTHNTLQTSITELKADVTKLQQEAVQAGRDATAALKSAKEGGEQQLASWRQNAAKELEGIRADHNKKLEEKMSEMKVLEEELQLNKAEHEELKKVHDEVLKLAEKNEKKYNTELGGLENKIDHLNINLKVSEEKLSKVTAELTTANMALQSKDSEVNQLSLELEKLELQLTVAKTELADKVTLLQGISNVAAQPKEVILNSHPSAVKKKARKSTSGESPAGSNRPSKRVHFQELPMVQEHSQGGAADHDDGWYGDDDGAFDDADRDDEADAKALVVHKGGVRTSQPLIQEVESDSGEEDEEEEEVQPRHKVPRTKASTKFGSSRRLGTMKNMGTYHSSKEGGSYAYGRKEKSSKKDKSGKSKKRGGKKEREHDAGVTQYGSVFSLFGNLGAGAYASPQSTWT